jgi:hypothetical protein
MPQPLTYAQLVDEMSTVFDACLLCQPHIAHYLFIGNA